MRAGILALVVAIAWEASGAGECRAQVLRDLAPVELEYSLLHGEPLKKVGSATISFRPTDTPRGRRLEVRARIEYTIQRKTAFVYAEEATLLCDGEGVARFDTSARAIGQERTNTGVRMGKDYQVTTTFQGKKQTKTITAGVQQSNFGLFASGFLGKRLEDGEMIEDFPLLYPVLADHMPRQRFREGVLPFTFGNDTQIPCLITRIDKPNSKDSDRLWNATKGQGVLLRMEEQTTLGKIVYELVGVNGKSPAESELLR